MTKLETQKTFEKGTFDWLKNRKTLKTPGRPPLTATERSRLYQVRNTAKNYIQTLTTLAELLPEEQLSQVFTEQQLMPLFKAIFNFGELPADQDSAEEYVEKKRKRLLPLCGQLIYLLDDHNFAELLAGPDLRSAAVLESNLLAGVRAIYLRQLIPPEKKKKRTSHT
jgi:predicted NAD/FAD-binding protein